ncbi:Gfo/Idh/MocA family oxidoreductase [Dethiosulfatarculus sandiegensis]|uniref:Oxidoreductase n=1 Tax=Dethiosulfatarculus sandiegensis TaxID=1429043 RepID=A0A0D2G948_9BACT|nr:Gfo/Idh/MocA family oxidoreductase [Dethiosulfatarculus sandiegensis]KIX11402.1 oxidoreductase [Dethiosulfatarculus sandiegensis]
MSAKNSSEIKVAAIGAGYWGKNLIRNFEALGALKVICESNPDTLENFKKLYPNVQGELNIDKVLSDPEIDALSISTPAETHFDLVKKGLLAGKHVFVEKPLCLKTDEGKELTRIANECERVLMVGHLLHYHPVVIKLKELINNGVLGRLQYIYSNRLNLGKIRTEENILWSFAPHDISVVLALTGQSPDTVSTQGSYFLNKNVADVTVSNLTFPSGIAAHIFVSWLHPFKEQKLVVVGDRSMAVFDDTEPDDKLLLYPHQVMWKNGVPVPDKKEAQKVEWEKSEPLRDECAHFLECVASGTNPLTDGEEGLRVLSVLAACQESMQKGGEAIKLNPLKDAGLEYQAHPSALVDNGVSVGKGTKIWHFSHVLSGSVVGEDCNIGQNVVIGPNVTVGNGCKIQNNVSIYKGVTLEDDVFCGPSMVFTNVFNPRSEIKRMDEVRDTVVKKGASIGANATIVCGNTIGSYGFIGAGSVVTKDVPDHALMAGNPAKQIGWMCRCGEKLLTKDDHIFKCPACEAQYVATENGLKLESK